MAFFPAYPFFVRVVALLTRDALVAGVATSLAAGAASAVLFLHWCRERLGAGGAVWALGAWLVYPFSFFVLGAVYGEGTFVVASLAAFSLLERDRPVLAGLAGVVATASRPVGIAVVAGLAVRALERRRAGPFGRGGERGRPRPADAGVLLSLLGLAAFMGYLAWRFGDPLAFSRVQAAEGWNRTPTMDALLKLDLWRRWRDFGVTLVTVVLSVHGLFALGALLLLPAVRRRFGWGYAVYTAIVALVPIATSTDFLAMGRHLIPAFPAFAVVGAWLSERPKPVGALALTTSALGMAAFVQWFARWFLLT